jgi:hypothetical protein
MGVDDRPPPVPPKDDVFEEVHVHDPPPRYPSMDMAYGTFRSVFVRGLQLIVLLYFL